MLTCLLLGLLVSLQLYSRTHIIKIFLNTFSYSVPNATFKTYITQNREDFNYIYREVREKRKYPINLMIVQDVVEPNRIYSPDKMAELQRKHGISKYLDQAIEAHPIVKQALMNAAHIDQVVLGNDRTQNSMDVHDLKTILATREDGSVKQACVSTTKDGRIYKYNITVSRYSGKVGVRTDDLDAVRGISPKFLKQGVDPDAVKALQQEIDGFRSALQQLIPTVEEKDREYQALMVSICNRFLAVLLYYMMSSPSLIYFLPTVTYLLVERDAGASETREGY